MGPWPSPRWCYLAGGAFLHRADDGLSGQLDQDVGAVVVQSHVVAVEGDDAQVGHDGAAACRRRDVRVMLG